MDMNAMPEEHYADKVLELCGIAYAIVTPSFAVKHCSDALQRHFCDIESLLQKLRRKYKNYNLSGVNHISLIDDGIDHLFDLHLLEGETYLLIHCSPDITKLRKV